MTTQAISALTKRERQMLDLLKLSPGPVEASALALELIGSSDASARQDVRVWVSRLRAKGVNVVTVHNVGYMLGGCEGAHLWVCACCGARHEVAS